MSAIGECVGNPLTVADVNAAMEKGMTFEEAHEDALKQVGK